jgi:anti-sigma factor RsiW
MKPFEELYTAWIDGRLTGDELADFERTLPDRAAAEADRAQVLRCGEFLRRHADAPALSNADFFSHQLMERIAAEERPASPVPVAERRPRFFTWPGLAWAGAFCAIALLGGYYAGQNDRFHRVPITSAAITETAPAQYDASIIKATSEDPAVSTSVYSNDGMTVLWLDGLEYLPASYQLQ